MYSTVLAIHNFMRWIVLAAALIALLRAYSGWLGSREWAPGDRRSGLFYSVSLDIQLLLGLILYFFLSPLTQTALDNFGAALANPEQRFFALEHIFYNVVAVVLVHVGAILSRRAKEPAFKHRNAAIWFSMSLIAILLAMPWWRPLLR